MILMVFVSIIKWYLFLTRSLIHWSMMHGTRIVLTYEEKSYIYKYV